MKNIITPEAWDRILLELKFWATIAIKKIRGWAGEHTDLDKAAERIKANVEFKGANAVVLAFSIAIASVGLNVNSTAVVIGAMLISPLMGPIIGAGFAIGTNDFDLLWKSLKNLGIMVGISLIVSSFYFLFSPLRLVNPTELEARTSPSLYDMIIALAGGLAGIFESLRKDDEKGTVIVGVAIATALMPPLCTVGYGLAHMNLHFILGASGLFLINFLFISLSATAMLLLLYPSEKKLHVKKGVAQAIAGVMLIIIAAGIFGVSSMTKDSKLEMNVDKFVSANKMLGKAYIHDYKIFPGKGRYADIYIIGDPLTNEELMRLYASAEQYNIKYEQLNIVEHAFGDDTEDMLQTVFDKTDNEIQILDARIRSLEEELEKNKVKDIPYTQIAQEIRTNYPEIKEISFGQGKSVDDSLRTRDVITILATTGKPMKQGTMDRLQEWARIRLEDSTAVVSNIVVK